MAEKPLHPLADLHEDWASYKRDTERADPFRRERIKELGTTAPEYDGNIFVNDVVFSADITGLEEGNVGLVVLNSFCEPKEPFMDLYPGQQDLYEEVIASDDNSLTLVRTSAELLTLPKDRIAVIHSVEGIYNYDGEIEPLLRMMWERGTRSIGPAWNGDNNFATGHATHDSHGLTERGKEMVKAADGMGFFIDLSHASTQTALDVLHAVKHHPVIITHTASKELVSTTRNVDARVALEVAKRGGIIGINCSSWMLEGGSKRAREIASVESAVRHYEFYRNLFARNGIEGVLAVGSDSNGLYANSRVRGLDRIDTLGQNLTEGLRKADFSDDEIAGILGRNATEFFKKNLPK